MHDIIGTILVSADVEYLTVTNIFVYFLAIQIGHKYHIDCNLATIINPIMTKFNSMY